MDFNLHYRHVLVNFQKAEAIYHNIWDTMRSGLMGCKNRLEFANIRVPEVVAPWGLKQET